MPASKSGVHLIGASPCRCARKRVRHDRPLCHLSEGVKEIEMCAECKTKPAYLRQWQVGFSLAGGGDAVMRRYTA